jgi:AcrR family transcriptional regulator
MATRLSRAEQRDQTRARLLDAAEKVFVERGFHAASVDEVAAMLGKRPGTIRVIQHRALKRLAREAEQRGVTR